MYIYNYKIYKIYNNNYFFIIIFLYLHAIIIIFLIYFYYFFDVCFLNGCLLNGCFFDSCFLKSWLFCRLWTSQKLSSYLNFKQIKKQVKKLSSYFADIEQVSYFSDIEQIKKVGCFFKQQLCYLWLPTPHCAVPVWLTGCYDTPLVTSSFPPILLPQVLLIWESVFYSQVFFTLHSFLLVSRTPWGRQFNLKVSRASCWSSKHSPGPTICLNHSNPQWNYVGMFYIRVTASYEAWRMSLTRFELFSWQVSMLEA